MRKKSLVLWCMLGMLSVAVAGCGGGTEKETQKPTSDISVSVDEQAGGTEEDTSMSEEDDVDVSTEEDSTKDVSSEEESTTQDEVEDSGVSSDVTEGSVTEDSADTTVTDEGDTTQTVALPSNVFATLDVTKEQAEAKEYLADVVTFTEFAYGGLSAYNATVTLRGQENVDVDGIIPDIMGENVVLAETVEQGVRTVMFSFDLDLVLADWDWETVDATQEFPWESAGRMAVADYMSIGLLDKYTGTYLIPTEDVATIALGTTGDVATFRRVIENEQYTKVCEGYDGYTDGRITAKVTVGYTCPAWYDGGMITMVAHEWNSPWGFSMNSTALEGQSIGTYQDITLASTLCVNTLDHLNSFLAIK